MKKLLVALTLVILLSVMLTSCGLTVPRPEIKEAEFDFSITYELDGEEQTFSAVYVCEYDGVSWTVESGNYTRDWKDHVEGTYEGDDYSAVIGTTEDGGDIILFFGIYPQYFMNDLTADRGAPEPSIYVAYPENEYGEMKMVNDPAEVERLYGARIISSEYDAPIENTFSVFN